MAYTDELAHTVAELTQSAVDGFRYYKSYHQFRRSELGVVDDIVIDVTSRRGGGAPYRLSFIFGVQYRDVEKIIAKVKGTKVTPWDRTILQNSYNIAPKRDMRFDGETVWSGIDDVSDLGKIKGSICTFLSQFVLSYHDRFHNIDELRERLAADDGWVLNQTPYEQILAIDVLRDDSVRAVQYLEWLQAKVDGGYNFDRERFNEFYIALRLDHPSVMPKFSLK
ncbi:MAG: hypothetical protein P8Z76_20630 [Alphaproteobacteria bacterium]